MPRAVDMAVRLGLRSYAEPGTARAYDPTTTRAWPTSSSSRTSARSRSGPFELNALELSNVAATLASGGMWCPPSPIDKVFDRHGSEVAVTTATCEQVVPEGLANTLANALGKDARATEPPRARPARWAGICRCRARPAPPSPIGRRHSWASPTSTRRRTTSSTTLPNPSGLCSFPLRRCANGDLYGGNEPARTWFLAMKPIADDFGPVKLPPTDPRYVDGRSGQRSAQRVRPQARRGA